VALTLSDPRKWPLPKQRQQLAEADYNAVSPVIGTRSAPPRGRSPLPMKAGRMSPCASKGDIRP
jgi:hypothetical protein